jgi:hypothetical protein
MSIKKIDVSQIKYTPLENEIVQDSKSGKFMTYHDGSWHTIQMEGGGI